MRHFKDSFGFTLIELLIVLGITATVSAIGAGIYTNQQRNKLLDTTVNEIVQFLNYA